ncbi:uncharacterized protein BDZ99DRAFT_576169 [Mytilinidion resinicola]|uniref:Uncharacterized protein n=1 Tax=Mytilinidion resinicola TaxID=574789 RepID=A0A6A6Y3L6_9PEZI|nr:uncharacterized protein BDZ99DRAFT_576169 [Mytilinidion resinicola]KAF2803250.1 hypothetical protein BDZ99DRAFT_576169 [Mytilinidion resinicola]
MAPQNMPAQQGPVGQIGFPIQNLVLDNMNMVVVVYHDVRVRMVRGEGVPVLLAQAEVLNIPTLVELQLAVTLLLGMVGSQLLNIWISKTALTENLKPEDLYCPQDILCIADDCKAQEEDKEILERNAFCKVTKHEGCHCRNINYPHITLVKPDYMDAQYEWLEQLIKLADMLPFEPKCNGALQEAEVLRLN